MKMQPIFESFSVKTNTKIQKDNDGNSSKDYFIEGIFLQADTLNKNRRIYPKTVLSESIKHYSEKFIIPGKALGERDHPYLNGFSKEEGFARYTTVKVSEVSHVIENLVFEGNDVYGRAKLLNTEAGKNIKAFIDGGIPINVSSRGIGDSRMAEGGYTEILPGFQIITVDVVANASAPGCVLNAIKESESWIWDRDIFSISEMEKIKSKDKFNEKEMEEYKNAFLSFFKILKN